jgi:glutamine synthetase
MRAEQPFASMLAGDDAEAFVANLGSRGVRAVRVLYADLHGIARGKDIPVSEFAAIAEEGLAFCAAVLTTDLHNTPVVGGSEGYVDLVARPDLATLRIVPWHPELAWCVADLRRSQDGERWPSCPRGVLASVLER